MAQTAGLESDDPHAAHSVHHPSSHHFPTHHSAAHHAALKHQADGARRWRHPVPAEDCVEVEGRWQAWVATALSRRRVSVPLIGEAVVVVVDDP